MSRLFKQILNTLGLNNTGKRYREELNKRNSEFDDLANERDILKSELEQTKNELDRWRVKWDQLDSEKKEFAKELTLKTQKLKDVCELPIVRKHHTDEVSSRKENVDANKVMVGLMKLMRYCDILLGIKVISSEAHSKLEKEIEGLLNVYNIHSVNGSKGKFNPNFQKIVDVVSTTDEYKNGTISQTLLRGFRQGEECLDPEEVEIFKFE